MQTRSDGVTSLLRHAPLTRFLIARIGSITAQQMLMLAIRWLYV